MRTRPARDLRKRKTTAMRPPHPVPDGLQEGKFTRGSTWKNELGRTIQELGRKNASVTSWRSRQNSGNCGRRRTPPASTAHFPSSRIPRQHIAKSSIRWRRKPSSEQTTQCVLALNPTCDRCNIPCCRSGFRMSRQSPSSEESKRLVVRIRASGLVSSAMMKSDMEDECYSFLNFCCHAVQVRMRAFFYRSRVCA